MNNELVEKYMNQLDYLYMTEGCNYQIFRQYFRNVLVEILTEEQEVEDQ
jgi:hypothetical protein